MVKNLVKNGQKWSKTIRNQPLQSMIHFTPFQSNFANLWTLLKGTELTIQYNSLLMGKRKRQELFGKVWFFHCKCPRCQDATEMGSFLSALSCQLCPKTKPSEQFSDQTLLLPYGSVILGALAISRALRSNFGLRSVQF